MRNREREPRVRQGGIENMRNVQDKRGGEERGQPGWESWGRETRLFLNSEADVLMGHARGQRGGRVKAA